MSVPAAPIASVPSLVTASGRQYRLYNTADTLIGSRGCSIIVSDPGVPPQAARLTPHGGGFLLKDAGGSPTVNGKAVTAPVPLKPGDKIKVGATEFVYHGPATPAVAAPPPIPVVPVTLPPPVMPVSPPVVSPPVPLVPLMPSPIGPALKSWSSPPAIEGFVELVDGPHRMDKGNTGAKVAAAVALGMVTRGLLTMLPFMGKQDVSIWFLRIKGHVSGRLVSVVMRGEPSSMMQMGDFVAIWGPVKDGNIIMQTAYNYTTDSQIQLRT